MAIENTVVKFCTVLTKWEYLILLDEPFFCRHKVYYESGLLGDNSPNVFLFLPSTVDRIEKINKYLVAVNLFISEIDPKDFGKNFDSSVLDSAEDNQEAIRESVLNLL